MLSPWEGKGVSMESVFSRAYVMAGIVLLACGLAPPLSAQEAIEEQGVETALQNESQPVAAARLVDQPAEEPIPELPPTIVPGRIGNFPAEPLEGDSVLSPNRNATPASESGS